MQTSKVVRNLQNKGYKITKARRRAIEFFFDRQKPSTAKDLLGLLHKNNLLVNKTTVYREIEFLLKMGLIQEVYIDPKRVYYESALLTHHHHLVCNNCGKIEDVVLEKDLSDTEEELEKKMKFKVSNHSLEFFGLCTNCH